MVRLLLLALCLLPQVLFAAVPIQTVQAGGLTAWLVEDHTLPLVRAQFSYRAGSAFVPPNNLGAAPYTAQLMLEGAGSYDAATFKEELAKIGAEFGVATGRLTATFSLTTLAEHTGRAFELATLALSAPQFGSAAAKRVQQQQLAAVKRADEQPGSVAAKLFYKSLYLQHPYAHPVDGTQRSVWHLDEHIAARYYRNNFHKKNLTISVVGAITAAELEAQLTQMADKLPAGNYRNAVFRSLEPVHPGTVKEARDINQSTLMLGHHGINRSDPDYYAAYVLNHILGGGGFTARLMQTVREERGLTYGIYSVFEPLPKAGPWYVSVKTEPANVPEVIALIKAEMQQLIDKKVSRKELQDAKAFLIDSFPLRLDNTHKINSYLSVMQQEKLGQDYLVNWPQKIDAVTRDDIQRVAARLLHPGALLVVEVGPHE